MVCHDTTVDRTTEGHGALHALTLEQVRSLDNSYWFVPGGDEDHGLSPSAYSLRGRAPEDGDFCIATLEEVLELMDGCPEVALNLDIKATAPAVEPYEDLLAQALAPPLCGPCDRGLFPRRGDGGVLRLAPEVATSAGTLAVIGFWRALHQGEEPAPMRHVALQVPAVQGDQVVVDDEFVEVAHRLGLAVHVWTANDVDQMARLCQMGIDGIISDLPTPLVRLLDERGMTYSP